MLVGFLKHKAMSSNWLFCLISSPKFKDTKFFYHIRLKNNKLELRNV